MLWKEVLFWASTRAQRRSVLKRSFKWNQHKSAESCCSENKFCLEPAQKRRKFLFWKYVLFGDPKKGWMQLQYWKEWKLSNGMKIGFEIWFRTKKFIGHDMSSDPRWESLLEERISHYHIFLVTLACARGNSKHAALASPRRGNVTDLVLFEWLVLESQECFRLVNL